MTPWGWNDYMLRQQERMLQQVERERQESADRRARRSVVGDGETKGETDGPGFWAKVGELASQAWGERGRVFRWGATSALDEVAESAKDMGKEQRERIDRIGEGMGVEAPDDALFSWRDSLGGEAPETAGGNMAAAMVQVVTGAGAAALTGGRGRMMGRMGAGPGARAAGTEAGGKVARAAEELTTGKAAASFAVSDYAAFAAEEERALVALNEVPAVGEFIPDILAQPLPDDATEAEHRSARALEGHVLGGVLGAAAEVSMQLARRSHAGLARGIEAPNKAEVREQIAEETIRSIDDAARKVQRPPYEERGLVEKAADEAEEVGSAAEAVGARPEGLKDPESVILDRINAAVAAGDDAAAETARQDLRRHLTGEEPEAAPAVDEPGDPMAFDHPAAAPEPALVEVAPGRTAGSHLEVAQALLDPAVREQLRADMDFAQELARHPSLQSWQRERTGRISQLEAMTGPGSMLDEQDPAFTELAGLKSGRVPTDAAEFDAIRNMAEPSYLEERLALTTASGIETGIQSFGTRADVETYLVARHHAWERLREWQAAPKDATRREGAIAAMHELNERYAAQAARGEPGGAPTFAERHPDRDGGQILQDLVAQTRDEGRRAPHLDPEVARSTGEVLTERIESVTESRRAEAGDLGAAVGDEHLARQRPSRMEGITLPPAYRAGVPYDEARRVDQPLDVWPENIQQPEHYGQLLDEALRRSVTPEVARLQMERDAVVEAMDAVKAEFEPLPQRRQAAWQAVEDLEAQLAAARKADTTGRVEKETPRPAAVPRTLEVEEARQAFDDEDDLLDFDAEEYERQLAIDEGQATTSAAEDGLLARADDDALNLNTDAAEYERQLDLLSSPVGQIEDRLINAKMAYRQANNAYEPVRKALKDLRQQKRSANTKLRGAMAAEDAAAPAAEASLQKMMRDHYDQSFTLGPGVDARAALTAIDAMAGTVHRMARGAADAVSDAAAQAAFARALQKFQGLVDHLQGNDAAVGRALERSRLPLDEAALEDAALPRIYDHDVIKRSGGISELRHTARGMSLVEDSAAVLDHLKRWRGEARYTWTQGERWGLHNVMRTGLAMQFANMLSGTATLGFNAIGGVAMMPLRLGENALAGAMGGFREGTPAAASPKTAAAKRLALSLYAVIPELIASLRIGAWHFAGDVDPRTGRMTPEGQPETWLGIRKQVDDQIARTDKEGLYKHAMSRNMMEESVDGYRLGVPRVMQEYVANDTLRGVLVGAGDAMGSVGADVLGLPGGGQWVLGAMRALDASVKVMSGRVQIRHDAITEALEQGLRGPAFKDYVERKMLRAADSEETMRRARVMGELNTGMEDPGSWTQWAMEQAQRYPVLRLALPMPFIRTPGNFMRQAVELTFAAPFNLAVSTATRERWRPFQKFLEDGERIAMHGTAEQKAQLKARGLLGMAMTMTIAGLTLNGLASGGSPDNKRIAAQKRKLGIRDYGLKIGDGWLDTRNLSGRLAMSFQAGMDATEVLASAERKEELDAASAIFASIAAAVGYMADETSVSNLMEIADVLSGNSTKKLDQIAVDAVKDRLTRLFGPGSADRQIARYRAGGVEPDYSAPGGMGGADEDFGEKVLEGAVEFARAYRSQSWWLGEQSNEFPKIQLWNGEPLSRVYPEGTDGLPRWTIAMGSLSQNKYMEEADDPVARAILDSDWVLQEIDDTLLVKDTARGGPGRMPSQTLEYTLPERTVLRQSFGRHFTRTMTKKFKSAYWRQAMADYKRTGGRSHRAVLHAELAEARKKALDYARGQVQANSPALVRRIEQARERMAIQANGGM